jgi:diacylglycerol kinase
MNYLKKRIKALGHAWAGLVHAFKKEVHLRLQAGIAILVVCSGFYFSISEKEWLIIGLCICLVLAFELLNSAIEKLCDLVTLEKEPAIKYIKDVSAAAVLLVAVFAAVCGLVIFIPYLKNLF